MIKTQLFIQLITAAAGSIGFGLLFHIRKRYLGLVGIGGMIGWLAYVFFAGIWEGVFLPSLAAGFIVDIYAEILARVCKQTSSSFFVTSIIPLVPGSTLFYCMSSIVEGNSQMALMYGRDTFYFALGIAVGMSAAWSICYFGRTVRKKQDAGCHPAIYCFLAYLLPAGFLQAYHNCWNISCTQYAACLRHVLSDSA